MDTIEALLPNGSTGDSLLLVRILQEGASVAFDAGDARRVPPSDVLRMRHVFISHGHVDHCVGLDPLIRPRVCREETLGLHGPAGFIEHVASRLGGYTWNLVDGNHFIIEARAHEHDRVRSARFDSGRGFARADQPDEPAGPRALDGTSFMLETESLDHHVVSQGWAVQGARRVTIHPETLPGLGLVAGPWLRQLVEALRRDDLDARIDIDTGRQSTARDLARDVATLRRGERIAYVTDTICDAATRPKIVRLAREADVLAAGTPFIDEEADRAGRTRHLLASQAGAMAREAGVATLLLFHVSDRHGGDVRRHVDEASREAGPGVTVRVQAPLPIQEGRAVNYSE